MRDHLAAVEGAAEHSGEWLDGIVAALAAQGAHTASDLDGAKFEDFEFPPATLTGAAKRLVRKAIDKATAAPNVVPQTPGTLGAAPSSDGGAAATAATAALAALLQKEDKKKEEALAAVPLFRWPAPPRVQVAHIAIGPVLAEAHLGLLPQEYWPRRAPRGALRRRVSQRARAQLRSDGRAHVRGVEIGEARNRERLRFLGLAQVAPAVGQGG